MLTILPQRSETIEGVGEAIRAGEISCVEVLQNCLDRIEEWEPKVRAWVVIDREGALEQARKLDAKLARGRCEGPLHGIPIGIKDIIDVEGLPTACGFGPWRDRIAADDAPLVENLRSAGAVILGKTVTTQFAWIDPPATRNPWNLERTPGGSSSGSAAAVATGMCLGAIGTQTGGSIIRPSSFCGVAGYKPNHGLMELEGILPFAQSFDAPGPIARTIHDARLMGASMVTVRRMMSSPDASTIRGVENAVKALLQPIRVPPTLVRPRGFFDRRAEPEMLEAFEKALATLKAAGAEITEIDDEFDFEAILGRHRLMMAAEAATNHASRFAESRDHYSKHIRALIDEGLQIPATRYLECHANWSEFRVLPVMVTPAAVGAAPDLSTTGNPCMNSPFSYLGKGVCSFPVALSREGLPLGIQITSFSNDHADEDTLAMAAWCESAIRRAQGAGSD